MKLLGAGKGQLVIHQQHGISTGKPEGFRGRTEVMSQAYIFESQNVTNMQLLLCSFHLRIPWSSSHYLRTHNVYQPEVQILQAEVLKWFKKLPT